MKFTPGPWRYDGRVYIFGPKTETIAMIRGTGGGTGEDLPQDENARLIAAAPDLYAALSELVRVNEEWNAAVEGVIGRPAGWNEDYLSAAKAAIAKVKSK